MADKACWEENVSTRSSVFATLTSKKLICNKEDDEKSNEKVLCVYFKMFLFLSIRACRVFVDDDDDVGLN